MLEVHIVTDIEVHLVTDIEVQIVSDIMVHIVTDIEVQIVTDIEVHIVSVNKLVCVSALDKSSLSGCYELALAIVLVTCQSCNTVGFVWGLLFGIF